MAAGARKKLVLDGVGGVILDIEGTICPISFVKEVLFPYFQAALPGVLAHSWDSPSFAPYLANFPAAHRATPPALLAHVADLMAADVKIPYLKSLQGYVWVAGYEAGDLRCPLFPDVAGAMRRWHAEGRRIVIYSSGSVPAQKLLLGHTTEPKGGDLRGLVGGWYDTVNAGMKNERGSYERIVEEEGRVGGKGWVFFSDNVAEVEAAEGAGVRAVLTVRPGNAEVPVGELEKYRVVESFEDVEFV